MLAYIRRRKLITVGTASGKLVGPGMNRGAEPASCLLHGSFVFHWLAQVTARDRGHSRSWHRHHENGTSEVRSCGGVVQVPWDAAGGASATGGTFSRIAPLDNTRAGKITAGSGGPIAPERIGLIAVCGFIPT